MVQLGFHLMSFHEALYFSIRRKSVDQVELKSDTKTSILRTYLCVCMIIPR
jgi:hypothetical protein